MENAEVKLEAQPNAEDKTEAVENADTIPQDLPNENSSVKIPIKFNKQVRELDEREAAELAQKGLKYDSIQTELELLRSLAQIKGQSIGDYLRALKQSEAEKTRNELLERTGGDESLADEIIALKAQSPDSINGLEELLENVEEIKTEADIPVAVMDAVKTKGGNVFDAYLRYKFEQHRKALSASKQRSFAKNASLGSQSSVNITEGASSTEFLRGIWG